MHKLRISKPPVDIIRRVVYIIKSDYLFVNARIFSVNPNTNI